MNTVMNCCMFKGIVRKTEGQEKKHYTQMSFEEKLYLRNKIKAIDLTRIKISKHLKKKEIDFNLADIIKIIKTSKYKIIEYNETFMPDFLDCRVLLRSFDFFKVRNKGKDNIELANVCFVISLINNRLITVYYNVINDNHCDMNYQRYNGSLKIIKNTESETV